MKAEDRTRLAAAVQANCHIADARHAADLSLCTYLLQMREFFRWEHRRPFGAELAREEVGAWIAEREALWERVHDRDFQRLPLPDGRAADPFDVEAIDDTLRPCGLMYGAGLLGAGRPVFFLAERHGQMQREQVETLVAGRELARGLQAPPAVLVDEHGTPRIVLRREALARWGWERFEAFTLRRTETSAFAAAVRGYGLDADFDAGLARFVDEQSEAVLLHELGELRVGRRLGPGWTELLLALPSRRGELHARAVRDQIADLETTLPALLDRGAATLIHVWFAAYDGIREALYPGLVEAYRAWRTGDDGAALRRACGTGRDHFERLAQQALQLQRCGDAAAIEALLSSRDAVCSVA